MKKTAGKIIAVVMAFALGVTVFPGGDIGAYAADDQVDSNVEARSVEQDNPLSALEDTLNGEGIFDSGFYTDGKYEYASEIVNVDVDVDECTMTVDWYGEADQMVIEFYDEDFDGENDADDKLIARKTLDVVPSSGVAHTEVSYRGDSDSLEYFVLKIYMLDSSGEAASLDFLSNSYTEEMYELRNRSIEDYIKNYDGEEDRIIKVSDVAGDEADGVEDNSFMVLKDETVLIKEENAGSNSSGELQVNVSDSDNGNGSVYIELSNMPDDLQDSIDSIEKDTPVFVIDKVAEDSQETTDFYMLKALDSDVQNNDGMLSAKRIEPTVEDATGYSALANIFKDVHVDKSIPYTIDMANIPTGTPCQLEGDLQGTMNFKFDFSIFKKNVVAMTFTNEVGCVDALFKYTTPSIGIDIPIREAVIGIPDVVDIKVGLKLRIWGDTAADVRFDFGLYSGIEIGVGYGGAFVNNKCQSPSFQYRGVDISGEVFTGFAYGIALEVAGGAVSVGGDLESGVIFTGRISSGHYYDGEKKYHSCDDFKCVTGDISIKLLGYSIGVSAKIFSKGFSGDILPPIKLMDWYYSGTYKDSAATTCPHWGYRLYVHVIDHNGEEVSGADVSYENDDKQYETLKSDKTDINGMATIYLPAGEHKIKVSVKDDTGHTFSKTVDFNEEGYNDEGDLAVPQIDIDIDTSRYKVSFIDLDQSGKADNMPEPVYAYNDQPTAQIPAREPTKSDRIFLGWTKEQGSSEVSCKPGDTITVKEDTQLYAVWAYSQYTVEFDKNKPGNASHDVEGEMKDQVIEYNESAVTLRDNKYTLAGWEFNGWNTKPDGTGDSYSDQLEIKDITQETITLYAQWEPKVYTVTFKDDGGVKPYTQNMYYDTPTQLNKCEFQREGSVFTHWSTLGLGSHYADKAKVTNLCSIDEEGNLQGYELTANWLEASTATIVVTDNGSMVDTNNAQGDIMLESINGSATFENIFEKKAAGVYSIKEDPVAPIPAGTYKVIFRGDLEGYDTADRTIEVENYAGVYNFDYCTVSISSDDHAKAWLESEGITGKDKTLIGTQLRIGTTVDEGYHFESYTAVGIAPGFHNGDPTVAEQTITVMGAVDINSHPAANLYKVVFHANDGDTDWTVTQDMVYDEPQDLFANVFERYGYEFAGWTETEEWTGHEYEDASRVENLTTENDGEFHLYAQWDPVETYIDFHANGGTGEMLTQKTFFDSETTLSPCEFEREHWHFTGWNTEEDGSGVDYPDEGKFISDNAEKGATLDLYAQWEMIEYEIVYDLDGGTLAKENPTFYTVGTEDFTLNNPTKQGYVFTGWTGSNGDEPEKEVTIAKGSGGDRHYTANWEPVKGADASGTDTSTGDYISIGWILLTLASLAGIIAILRRMRRMKGNDI